MESCVLLEQRCGCEKHHWYKIRFYPVRIPIDTAFDKLPKYDGVADLMVTGIEAHITAFVMSSYARFRRMHDNDLEKMIRLNLPNIKKVFWERHRGGETIKLMREFN